MNRSLTMVSKSPLHSSRNIWQSDCAAAAKSSWAFGSGPLIFNERRYSAGAGATWASEWDGNWTELKREADPQICDPYPGMNSSRRGQRECPCIFGRRRVGVPPGNLRRPPLLVKSRAAPPPQWDTREPTGGRASTSASGWKIICSQCQAATPVDAASKQWHCCRAATQTPWVLFSSDFGRCVFTSPSCLFVKFAVLSKLSSCAFCSLFLAPCPIQSAQLGFVFVWFFCREIVVW